jgi:hypothetical protein
MELSGMVVDSRGAPVERASVGAESSVPDVPWAPSLSDATGAFRISGLPPGRYIVSADKAGYPRKVIDDVDVTSSRNLRIVLDAGGTIYGTITGCPPEYSGSLAVRAQAERAFSEGRPDQRGSYRLEASPTGDVSVVAYIWSGGTYRSTPEVRVKVGEGESVQADLAFEEGIEIRGWVLRDGKPLAGAMIAFERRDRRNESAGGGARTGSDGAYSLLVGFPGEYDVIVLDERTRSRHTTTYTVTGPGTFDVDIRAHALRGRVIDSDTGQPVLEVAVDVAPKDPSQRWLSVGGKSDSGGAFLIPSISAGAYTATASKKGYGSQSVAVEITDDPPQELTFSVARAEGLRLRLVDGRDGRSLEAWIGVFDAQHRLLPNSGFPQARDGVHRLDLSPGSYQVLINAGGYANRLIRVNAPSPEIRVVLTPGGTLRVNSAGTADELARLLLPGGEAYPFEWDVEGTFRIRPGTNSYSLLAPGTYTLVLLDASNKVKASKSVTVEEGKTTDVSL